NLVKFAQPFLYVRFFFFKLRPGLFGLCITVLKARQENQTQQYNKKEGFYSVHSLKIIGKGKRFIAKIHLVDFQVNQGFGFWIVGQVEEHLYEYLMGKGLVVHIAKLRIGSRYPAVVLLRHTFHFRHFAMLGTNAGFIPEVVSLLIKFKGSSYTYQPVPIGYFVGNISKQKILK